MTTQKNLNDHGVCLSDVCLSVYLFFSFSVFSVCLSVCLRPKMFYIFVLLHNYWADLTSLAQSMLRWRRFKSLKIKGHICIQGDITRILWKLVCNLNTNFRISYFARMAETCMEAFSGRVVLMSNHYINVCSGSTFLGWHFTQKTIDQTLW